MAASSTRIINTIIRGRRVSIEFGLLNAVPRSGPERLCLMLPCSGSHYKQWQPLAARVADGIAAVGVNAFGTGESTVPEGELQLADAAAATALVAHEVHADCPVSVVGHSYGGSVGAVAARHLVAEGRTVDALVLFEPNAVYLMPEELGDDGAVRRQWSQLVRPDAEGGAPEEMARQVHDFWNGAGAWDGLSVRAQARIASTLRHTLPREVAMLLDEAPRGAGHLAFLGGLVAEKHYLHGTVGTAPMIRRLAALLAAEAGFSTHAMADVDHMGPLTQPEPVAARLARCARLDGGGGSVEGR